MDRSIPAGNEKCQRSDFSRCFFAFLCLFFGLFVAAPVVAEPHEKVVLQLKWQHQFQFAGYYAAVEKGYYRAAGLDVELREGSPGTDTVAEVASGRAQFGVGNSSLLLARQAGHPVVALAAVFQHSPLLLVARRDAGINSPADLAGKKVALEAHSEELLAFLKKAGVDKSMLGIRAYSLNLADLLAGRIDAQSAYATDELFLLRGRESDFQIFAPREAGIDFYGDTLFTVEREVVQAPQRVAAFREASLRGWKYAMEHPEEIIDLILTRYAPRQSREHLLFEAGRMVSLVRSDFVEIGYMHEQRWRHIVDIHADLGVMPRDFALNGFLWDADAQLRQERRRLAGIAFGLLALTSFLAVVVLLFVRGQRLLRREMAAREKINAELLASEKKFRFIAENTGDVIWSMDIATRRFSFVSPAIMRQRGFTPEEMAALPAFSSLAPESAAQVQAFFNDAVDRWKAGERDDSPRVIEIAQPHRDGRMIPTEIVMTLHGEGGEPTTVVGITRDITGRKKDDEYIRHLAFFDALTDLPNRRLLHDRLEQAVTMADREQTGFALMFIDLDDFKPINDELGHEAGDLLLQEVARRMKQSVRASDTVARLGGDEFVVLLPRAMEDADVLRLADKIRLAVTEPFVMQNGRVLRVSCSVGVALYPRHGRAGRELLKVCDDAMYAAKSGGRNQVRMAADEWASGLREPEAALSFHWKTAFETGHPVLDAEHRQLFILANRLLVAGVGDETASTDFGPAADALIAHIARHFVDEERVLAEVNFPALKEHGRRHAELLERALALRAGLDGSRENLGEWLQFVAAEVIVGHIIHEDSSFHEFLKAATGGNKKSAQPGASN